MFIKTFLIAVVICPQLPGERGSFELDLIFTLNLLCTEPVEVLQYHLDGPFRKFHSISKTNVANKNNGGCQMAANQVDTDKLLAMCGKYGISFLGIFGSYARGDVTPKSDLDLLARFSKRMSLLDLVKTEREISDALGIKVDLLTEKSLSPYLKNKIMGGLKVIYDRERR